MSFIQCKSEEEVEKILKQKKVAFVTEDHRVYDEITVSDDAMYYDLDAETLYALYDLQLQIEMVVESGYEMSFLEIEKSASDLRKVFDKALAAIKFKPLRREKK